MKKVILLLSISFSINNFGAAVTLCNEQKNVPFEDVFSIELLIEDLEIINTITSNNINRYKVINRDGDTVLHVLVRRIVCLQRIIEAKRIKEVQSVAELQRIVDRVKARKKTQEEQEDIEQLKVYIKSLNKLSDHFHLFRNIPNHLGSKPFDILIIESSSMCVAGSIRNFKGLIPSIKPDQEAISTIHNASVAIPIGKALQNNALRQRKRGLLVVPLEEE